MAHTLVLVVIETTQSHRRTVFLWPLAGSENHNRCGACKFCGCSSTNEWGKWICHIENIQDICILFTEELQYDLQLLWMTHFNYWNSMVPSVVQSFSVVYRTTMLGSLLAFWDLTPSKPSLFTSIETRMHSQLCQLSIQPPRSQGHTAPCYACVPLFPVQSFMAQGRAMLPAWSPGTWLRPPSVSLCLALCDTG